MKNTGITYTSAERSPVILPEMAELLPPLSAEQLDALEADLIKNGCYAFEHLDYDYLLALENELVKDIHYKEGIEYPRDWKSLPAFIPRLCAKYPYQEELQQEGCDWNCDLKEIRDLLAAGRKFDSEHGNKKKSRRQKGGDAR